MHIAITACSTTVATADDRDYTAALLSALPIVAPQHTFTFITDAADLMLPTSVGVVQVPLATGYFSLRRWYGNTLPALLKTEKTDALISINGSTANIGIPQLPVLISTSAALQGCSTWLRFLYKSYLAKRLQKASSIGVISRLQAAAAVKTYGIRQDQFLVTGYAVPAAYQPVADWQQREVFLQQQTGGREYFFCIGNISEVQLLHLLKAFSLFKKRQQSNMQLLIPLSFAIGKKLQEKLDTYKYRQDVQLMRQPEKDALPQLLTCAYAVLLLNETAQTAFAAAGAIQCRVPIIGLESNEALKEIAGNAALYADATMENLAEQMKLIYKDEALRQHLIYNAQLQATQTDGREAARKVLDQLINM